MTLQRYLILLGWNKTELCRQAEIDVRTATKALYGEKISARAARKIAQAISDGTGKTVLPGEIEGLNF